MAVNPASCPFCEIIAGGDADARVVHRNEKVTAFFPLQPATRGHTLVVPNRHVADLTNLTVAESRDLGEAVHRIARAVRSALSPDGLNVIQSTGAAATQTVPHVHFHVVPRWSSDRMILRWPQGAAEDDAAQDMTLLAIREVLPPGAARVSAEDRRQHLSFIQAVITRMSQASSSSKSWLLPIVTLAYGYAITSKSPMVALLGCLAVLVFGVLDANYLKQERAFRKLYDEVASGRPIPAFSMNPALASPVGARANYWPDKPDLRSWAVAPVYVPLTLAGLSIAAWLFYR
ncbi:HIT family protein [Streptomyces sp. 1222.5]|uniref:HIT family protein n=1 Tax=Streptomyces sp. 1222.5 TaxID=1881026 RepID=UPI003D708848